MKSVCLVVACAFIIFGATAIVIALHGAVQDTDMPTPSGECHTGVGCHTVRNADGIINLSAIANDGEWNTSGESGSLKVTVNTDLADCSEPWLMENIHLLPTKYSGMGEMMGAE